MRRFRESLSYAVKDVLDALVFRPAARIGVFMVRARCAITGEGYVATFEKHVEPKLVKISLFIGKATDIIDGQSNHLEEVKESWERYYSNKEVR